MSPETYAIVGMGAAILVFLWTLRRDVRRLGERVAGLEGILESLRGVVAGRHPSPASGAG